jgi:hypothetical protein
MAGSIRSAWASAHWLIVQACPVRGHFRVPVLIGLRQRTSVSRRPDETRGIPEKPVHPSLLDSLLPFSLGAFCFELTLPLFLFEFSLSFDSPFVLPERALAILDFSDQDDLDHDVRHARFELLTIIILPSLL